MSPLDDDDLDRMGDKMKLAVREESELLQEKLVEAFRRHRFDDHEPLNKKVDVMQTRILIATGILMALIWLAEHVLMAG